MMKKRSPDLIIEAAHFMPNGQLDYVRAYQKRGATYSDCLLLKRGQLVELIDGGLKAATGQRIHLMGNKFTRIIPVKLVSFNNHITFTTGDPVAGQKDLPDIPTI
jgi:hypothetical protein